MSTSKLDLLAFGVHPDDVELGCAGTLLMAMSEGKRTGIIDLTRGELGTRGSAELRLEEATRAAAILKVSVRENLGMADGFFEANETNLRKIITVIRRYQPDIILANAPEDRHPDHGRSAQLVADAAFLSGLRKISTQDGPMEQPAWRPSYVFHYIQDRFIQPGFVIDISPYMEQKMSAILAYGSQFYSDNSNEPTTYISTPQFLETVKARAMMLGKRIGVAYAEGYISDKIIGLKSFDGIIKNVT